MIAAFEYTILPGLVTLVIMTIVLVIVLLHPLRSEEELTERELAKKRKKVCDTDVLNVESKGDSI